MYNILATCFLQDYYFVQIFKNYSNSMLLVDILEPQYSLAQCNLKLSQNALLPLQYLTFTA